MTQVFHFGYEPFEDSGTSITLDYTVFPPAANNAMIASIVVPNAATDFDTPAGWDLVGVAMGSGGGALAVFYHDATGSETTQAFTWDISQDVVGIAEVFETADPQQPLMWAGAVEVASTGTTHDAGDVVPVWPCPGASNHDAIHLVIGQEPGPQYDNHSTNTTGLAQNGEVDHSGGTVSVGFYSDFADSDGTYDPGAQLFLSSKDRFSIAYAIRVRCEGTSYLGMLAAPL